MNPRLFRAIRSRLTQLTDLLDEIEAEATIAEDVAAWQARGGEPSRIGTVGRSDPTSSAALDRRRARIRQSLHGVDRGLRVSLQQLSWRVECLAAALRDEPPPPPPRRGPRPSAHP